MEQIPLFPLNTVLFPNGNLSLRIFEPRYLSMVSTCMKHDRPFGVVLIDEGKEAGTAAKFHDMGTLAKIVDFDRLQDGMLGLSCIGLDRFKVIDHVVREDNLIVATLELIHDDGEVSTGELIERFQSLTNFLRQTLDNDELKDYRKGIIENWNSSSWISFQMAELLPLSADSRQLLLKMSTAERLSELAHVLQENELV